STVPSQHSGGAYTDDGWGDASDDFNENVFRGTLLKCTHGHWTIGRDRAPMKPGLRLVATGTIHYWAKWVDKRPADQIVRKSGERLPERSTLGDTDKSKWPIGLNNEPQDVWQETRSVFFVDPETANVYTLPFTTFAGRGEVRALGDAITRMRIARK